MSSLPHFGLLLAGQKTTPPSLHSMIHSLVVQQARILEMAGGHDQDDLELHHVRVALRWVGHVGQNLIGDTPFGIVREGLGRAQFALWCGLKL